jgi:predicted enzyme related to lactoylglutathione lyase
MRMNLDHAHIFASDLGATVSFFRKMFDAGIVWDEEAAGARNVRLALGRGFIHVYDQEPKSQHGVFHHLGIETDDLHALVRRMNANGVSLQNPVRDTPTFSYVMTAGPDNLLLELFECREPQRWQITA